MIPKLRFRNFSEPWQSCLLNEFMTERKTKQTISEDAPLLSFSYEEGVILPENKKSNKRDFLIKDKDNKKFALTEYNDIIYNPANVIHGAIHRNKLGRGVVSPIYKIFTVSIDAKFAGTKLHSDRFIQEATKYIEGSVVKLRTLSPEAFLSMQINIPCDLKEQSQIGDYFEKIDDIITLNQKKCDKLIAIKQGLLSKMFPKEGESVPELRFPGFTDDWEQRKLGEIVDVQSGRDYKHLDEGDIPVYGTGGYMLSVNQALSYEQDAIGIGRKGTIDKPYILKAPFWTVDTLFYALPRENNKLNFLHCVFQNIDWKKKDESTGVPSLSKTTINDVDILVPKEDEQKEIGLFFVHLDNLITLHQRKVEQWQIIKKGFLQQMFC